MAGARESAGEIGHIIMQIGGPVCGCGNQGCLEALASRTAIERDIRAALLAGGASKLSELSGGDLTVIRSGAIRKALKAEDALVTDILHRAAETLGYACLTVRHLVDPEVIVLGGGLIEACSEFMMPILENIVGSDRLPGARDGGHVLLSALGDDAVVLGAVALARKQVGRSPFKKRYRVEPTYPEIVRFSFGQIVVGKKAYDHDIYIPVSGKVKSRDKGPGEAGGRGPARHRAQGTGRGLPRRPRSAFRRLRQGQRGQSHRAGPAVFEPAIDPLRGPARRATCGRLQQVESPQGSPDSRHVPRELTGNRSTRKIDGCESAHFLSNWVRS